MAASPPNHVGSNAKAQTVEETLKLLKRQMELETAASPSEGDGWRAR